MSNKLLAVFLLFFLIVSNQAAFSGENTSLLMFDQVDYSIEGEYESEAKADIANINRDLDRLMHMLYRLNNDIEKAKYVYAEKQELLGVSNEVLTLKNNSVNVSELNLIVLEIKGAISELEKKHVESIGRLNNQDDKINSYNKRIEKQDYNVSNVFSSVSNYLALISFFIIIFGLVSFFNAKNSVKQSSEEWFDKNKDDILNDMCTAWMEKESANISDRIRNDILLSIEDVKNNYKEEFDAILHDLRTSNKEIDDSGSSAIDDFRRIKNKTEIFKEINVDNHNERDILEYSRHLYDKGEFHSADKVIKKALAIHEEKIKTGDKSYRANEHAFCLYYKYLIAIEINIKESDSIYNDFIDRFDKTDDEQVVRSLLYVLMKKASIVRGADSNLAMEIYNNIVAKYSGLKNKEIKRNVVYSLWYQGNILEELGKYECAIKKYIALYENYKDNNDEEIIRFSSQAGYRVGYINEEYFGLDKLNDALRYYNDVCESFENSGVLDARRSVSLSMFSKGNILILNGDVEEGILILKDLLEKFKDDKDPQIKSMMQRVKKYLLKLIFNKEIKKDD